MGSIKYNFNGKDDIYVFPNTKERIRCEKAFAKSILKGDYDLNDEQLSMVDDYNFIVDGLKEVHWEEYEKFVRDFFEEDALEIYKGLEN